MSNDKYNVLFRGYIVPPETGIVVHNHDVLNGRGVHIAHHPGNERFRSLVTTRADESYCTAYSATEKKAVAEEIIMHIKTLDPPGRFLRRVLTHGRPRYTARGLNGPWEELSDREALKKTCQALRDCNRCDRKDYAAAVPMPDDVRKNAEQRAQLGLSGKEQAAAAAAAVVAAADAQAAHAAAMSLRRASSETSQQPLIMFATTEADAEADAAVMSLKRAAETSRPLIFDTGRVSPSVESAAVWLKKQRTDDVGMMSTAAVAADYTGYHHDPQVVAAAAAAGYNPNSVSDYLEQQQLQQQSGAPSEVYNDVDDDDDEAVAEAAAAAGAIEYPMATSGTGYSMTSNNGFPMATTTAAGNGYHHHHHPPPPGEAVPLLEAPPHYYSTTGGGGGLYIPGSEL